MKILLVEDNTKLSSDLAEFFTGNDFLVEIAETYLEAQEKIGLYVYDIAILDLGLPDGNGLDLIFQIKEKDRDTGILILTARHAVDDKVKGLNLGADDYMTKPFHRAELNARIHSLIRRKKSDGNNIFVFNEIKVDIFARIAWVRDVQLNLTRKEFDLLMLFLDNKNRLLTKENIAEYLWGDHFDQSDNFDFIYNHIKNLRNKISGAKGENYIRSVYGLGYKFSTT
jgi:DNA-binding response OmpR family regulator